MWMLLERVFDAVVLATLVGVAVSTSSRFERAALLTAAALLLIGWIAAWRSRRG
jgi:hypothetical protein